MVWVKVQVYRKKTHTNQYLSFSSHHLVHPKLGVIHIIQTGNKRRGRKVRRRDCQASFEILWLFRVGIEQSAGQHQEEGRIKGGEERKEGEKG